MLLAMALDRYMAICHPLRYATILTPKLIAKIGIAALLRSAIPLIPLLVRLAFFSFCRSHVLSHSIGLPKTLKNFPFFRKCMYVFCFCSFNGVDTFFSDLYKSLVYYYAWCILVLCCNMNLFMMSMINMDS